MKSVVRYSEIGLKGSQTRRSMEKVLKSNIKSCVGKVDIWSGLGRIIVDTDDAESISRVFGVASASPVIQVKSDIDEIKEAALKLYTEGSFRISCRRVTKDTKETSMDIMKIVGAYVGEKTGAKVSLKDFDVDIGIEIIGKKAYVFNTTYKGPAGLPLGTQGKVAMEFDGSDKAIAAAYLIMKRGVEIIPVGETSEGSKILDERWTYGLSFKPAEGDVKNVADERSCMGIVLSREMSLDSLAKMKKETEMLILSPLMGYSKEEIKRISSLVTKK
jgi:thiamine biosynthesis protein ThiI